MADNPSEKDQGTNEVYKESAAVVFGIFNEHRQFCQKMQAEYGRWLVNSLLFLHSSAIAGIYFKAQANPNFESLKFFIVGIVLALLTGFLAWLNFTVAMHAYHHIADHRMLFDKSFWPQQAPKGAYWVDVFMYGAVATGFLSVGSLVLGLVRLANSHH